MRYTTSHPKENSGTLEELLKIIKNQKHYPQSEKFISFQISPNIRIFTKEIIAAFFDGESERPDKEKSGSKIKRFKELTDPQKEGDDRH